MKHDRGRPELRRPLQLFNGFTDIANRHQRGKPDSALGRGAAIAQETVVSTEQRRFELQIFRGRGQEKSWENDLRVDPHPVHVLDSGIDIGHFLRADRLALQFGRVHEGWRAKNRPAFTN